MLISWCRDHGKPAPVFDHSLAPAALSRREPTFDDAAMVLRTGFMTRLPTLTLENFWKEEGFLWMCKKEGLKMILQAMESDREMVHVGYRSKDQWIDTIKRGLHYGSNPAEGARVCKMMTATPAFLQTLDMWVLKQVIAKLPDVACPLEPIYSIHTGTRLVSLQLKSETVNRVFQYLPIKMEVNFAGRPRTMVVKRHWSKEELLGRIMIEYMRPPDISYQYGGSFNIR
jgi:hypothetical protein